MQAEAITVVIIEDEQWAIEGLKSLLKRHPKEMEVLAELSSISQSITWFKENTTPDLIFCDIQLTDGLSFSIFQQVELDCPIIFTTAYDQYALKAFKLNSIDYLLKPIDLEDLSRALSKYQQLFEKQATYQFPQSAIEQMLGSLQKKYKERFVVKSGSRLLSIPTEEILYFFSESKVTWLRRADGKKFALNYKMEEIVDLLSPDQFFRISRAVITCHNGIEEILTYTNSRLKVQLKFADSTIVVSRDRVGDFKVWLG